MQNIETWSQTKRKVDSWKATLIEQRGARDQLIRVKEAEAKKFELYEEQSRLSRLAQLFLLSEITERRQEAIETIEKMGTYALRMVYGDGYALKFNTFEEKRKEGQTNFKMEINIESPYSSDDTLVTGLMDERGGGVAEIVAFSLRMAALNWLGYSGPLILDEAYKSMSNDKKLSQVADFVRTLTDNTGRQIIFATHKAKVFGKISDQIIRVNNSEGLSSCDIINDVDITDDFE